MIQLSQSSPPDAKPQFRPVQGTEEDIDILTAEKEELQKTTEELKNLVAQREEDLERVKERMETAMSDLDTKLSAETRTR